MDVALRTLLRELALEVGDEIYDWLLRLLHGSTSPWMGWRSTFEGEIHPAHVLIRSLGHGEAEAGFTIEPAPPGM